MGCISSIFEHYQDIYMGFIRFAGAALGMFIGGPIGAMVGFVIGSMIENFHNGDAKLFEKEQRNRENSSDPGQFEISLLILSAIIIKADGKPDQRELDYVRAHFVQQFGKTRANKAFNFFNEIIKNETISMQRACLQLQRRMSYNGRIQVIRYLFGIAASDGYVGVNEINEIRKMAGFLRLNRADFDTIADQFSNYRNRSGYQKADSSAYSSKSGYETLGISKSATDSEIKKAYRKMAKIYHPDKQHGASVAEVKIAEEKFKEISAAYELLQLERGF